MADDELEEKKNPFRVLWPFGAIAEGTPEPFAFQPKADRRDPAPDLGPGTIAGDWASPARPDPAFAARHRGRTLTDVATGEGWFSEGSDWSRAGKQTAPTGEPGESGWDRYVSPERSSPEGRTTVPVLPEPADFPGPLPPGLSGPPPMRDRWATDPQFTTTMPTTFGPAAPPGVAGAAYAPGAVGALYGKNLQTMEGAVKARAEAQADKADLQTKSLEDREKLLTTAKQHIAEYQEGLKKAQGVPGAEGAPPKAPELKKMPAAPDVKIRPWLDPEGKDALSVIAQTLAMFAVGIGGIVHKAPLTTLKYFREAAEAWRRDEVDAATSALKKFEISVQSIKGDNELALKQYEIADKQYAHNVEAKKAAVVSSLDALNLHDHALTAASLPYDEAVKALSDTITGTSSILTHLEKYQDVVNKSNKAAGDIPGSLFKLVGELEGIKARLANPNDPAASNPAEKAQLQRRQNVLEQTRDHYVKIQQEQVRDRVLATQQGAEYKNLAIRMGQSITFKTGLTQLLKDYTTLEKAGLLPDNATRVADWIASAKRQFPNRWSPETEAAFRGIQAFYPEIVIGLGRTYFNDIGVRTKDAFGPLEGKAISFAMAKGYIERAWARVQHFELYATYKMQELGRALGGPEGAGPYQNPALPDEGEPVEAPGDGGG